MFGFAIIRASELATLHARAARADAFEATHEGTHTLSRDLVTVLRATIERDTPPPAPVSPPGPPPLPVSVAVACRQYAGDRTEEAENLAVAEAMREQGRTPEEIVAAIARGDTGALYVVLGGDGDEEGEPFSPTMPRVAS